MPSLRPASLLKAALLLALPSLLTGCSNMVTTASVGAPLTLTSVTGKLHGGSNLILGATVNLYAAGTTGYGTGSTLLAQTTSSSTDSSFSFTQVATQPGTLSSSYACTANQQLYLLGIGGNTQGTGTNNNAASVLMAVIGTCSQASNVFVDVNEVSTAASVAALAQYINPGTSTPGSMTLGTNGDYTIAPTATAPNQAGAGLNNAFAIVPYLQNIYNGSAATTFSPTSSNAKASVSNVFVTATIETAKLNTIANILAACVNQTSATSSTGCSTLFTNAVPPNPAYTSQPGATFATAVDTLQAVYYMFTNPTNVTPPTTGATPPATSTNTSTANLAALYNLSNAQAPFQPILTVQPSDWTIGIVYTAGSKLCAGGGPFINYGYNMSIDVSGNIWMANGTGTNSDLAEMSPLGAPLNCSTTIPGTRSFPAIDTLGNVWLASNTSAFIYKFDGTNTIAIPVTGTTSPTTYTVSADGSGNVFFVDSANALLYELPATATAASTPLLIGTSGSTIVPSIAIDRQGNALPRAQHRCRHCAANFDKHHRLSADGLGLRRLWIHSGRNRHLQHCQRARARRQQQHLGEQFGQCQHVTRADDLLRDPGLHLYRRS